MPRERFSSGIRPMPITATNIRRGMTILFEGEPCRIIEFNHHTPGNLRAMVHAKMRKLKSGVTVEHRFRASDQVEEARMETHELQYMYHDGHSYHFMNKQTYDQYELDEEALGDHAQWMTAGMEVRAECFERRPIGVDLPTEAVFDIEAPPPVMRTPTRTRTR